MNIFKRLSALILCLIMIFSFTACGGKSTDSSGNSSVDEATAISKSDVNFVIDGESAYRIVRSAVADQSVFDSSTDLFKHFKNTLNVTLKNVADDEEQGDNAEILIGNTNRPETATAKQLLRQKGAHAENFMIATINKAIVIVGLSDSATIEGVKYFKENFAKSTTVAGGINYVNEISDKYSKIQLGNATDLLDYVIVKPYNNLSYITVLEIEKMQKLFLEKFGYDVKAVKDVDQPTAGAYEIVIGAAKRDGVEKMIEGDKVSVKITGNKVYLNGGSTYSVAAAVTEFCNMLSADGDIKLADANSKVTDYETVAATINNKESYVATFRDSFDTQIDLTKWNNYNDYNQYGQNGKWAKRAKEDYSNLSVVDGVFVTQIAEDDEAYYGSMLTTQFKMAFKYGYFEISQIAPKGDAFWSSLWTRPAFATSLYWTEIDVNECFGMSSITRGNCFPWLTTKGQMEGLKTQGGDICWENNYTIDYRYKDGIRQQYVDGDEKWEGGDMFYSYHTYGCEWTYDTISFYIDGEAVTVKPIDDLNQPIGIGLRNQHAYLIVGCIAGSDNLHTEQINNVTDKEWEETSRYYVDDVAVYQKDGMDIQYDYKDRHYGYTTKTHYND